MGYGVIRKGLLRLIDFAYMNSDYYKKKLFYSFYLMKLCQNKHFRLSDNFYFGLIFLWSVCNQHDSHFFFFAFLSDILQICKWILVFQSLCSKFDKSISLLHVLRYSSFDSKFSSVCDESRSIYHLNISRCHCYWSLFVLLSIIIAFLIFQMNFSLVFCFSRDRSIKNFSFPLFTFISYLWISNRIIEYGFSILCSPCLIVSTH